MRALQKRLEQPELVHDLERRRMDRIAAKVAQKIAVLLEQDDAHAGARQQHRRHHPGRTTADDAALRLRSSLIEDCCA